MASFDDVAGALRDLLDEQGTPRNVREKVTRMLQSLKSGEEPRVLADKLLMSLDELQSDINIPSYVRTQLWNVSSMLEALDH